MTWQAPVPGEDAYGSEVAPIFCTACGDRSAARVGTVRRGADGAVVVVSYLPIRLRPDELSEVRTATGVPFRLAHQRVVESVGEGTAHDIACDRHGTDTMKGIDILGGVKAPKPRLAIHR